MKAVDGFSAIMKNGSMETTREALQKLNEATAYFQEIYNRGYQEGHEAAMKKLEL